MEAERKKCVTRCKRAIYTVKKGRVISKHGDTKTIVGGESDKVFGLIQLHVESMYVTRVEEELTLSPEMLLSFVGGIIGMFMGVSFFSLVSPVIKLFLMMKNFISRRLKP